MLRGVWKPHLVFSRAQARAVFRYTPCSVSCGVWLGPLFLVVALSNWEDTLRQVWKGRRENATRLVWEHLQRPPGGGGGAAAADKQEEIDGKLENHCLLLVFVSSAVTCSYSCLKSSHFCLMSDVYWKSTVRRRAVSTLLSTEMNFVLLFIWVVAVSPTWA